MFHYRKGCQVKRWFKIELFIFRIKIILRVKIPLQTFHIFSPSLKSQRNLLLIIIPNNIGEGEGESTKKREKNQEEKWSPRRKREKKRRERAQDSRMYERNFSLPLFVSLFLSLSSHFRETFSRFWLFSLIEKSANCFSPICTCFNVEHCLE